MKPEESLGRFTYSPYTRARDSSTFLSFRSTNMCSRPWCPSIVTVQYPSQSQGLPLPPVTSKQASDFARRNAEWYSARRVIGKVAVSGRRVLTVEGPANLPLISSPECEALIGFGTRGYVGYSSGYAEFPEEHVDSPATLGPRQSPALP